MYYPSYCLFLFIFGHQYLIQFCCLNIRSMYSVLKLNCTIVHHILKNERNSLFLQVQKKKKREKQPEDCSKEVLPSTANIFLPQFLFLWAGTKPAQGGVRVICLIRWKRRPLQTLEQWGPTHKLIPSSVPSALLLSKWWLLFLNSQNYKEEEDFQSCHFLPHLNHL